MFLSDVGDLRRYAVDYFASEWLSKLDDGKRSLRKRVPRGNVSAKRNRPVSRPTSDSRGSGYLAHGSKKFLLLPKSPQKYWVISTGTRQREVLGGGQGPPPD